MRSILPDFENPEQPVRGSAANLGVPTHEQPTPASLDLRPGPQPCNAGITPGYRHLFRSDGPVSRRELRRLIRKLRRQSADLEALALAIARIQRQGVSQ